MIGSFKDVFMDMLPELKAKIPKYDTARYLKQRRKNARTLPPRNVVHIDMDCYFVSVAIRHDPSINTKACVVCHSRNSSAPSSSSRSTSEIASANYVCAPSICSSQCAMLTSEARSGCSRLGHFSGNDIG